MNRQLDALAYRNRPREWRSLSSRIGEWPVYNWGGMNMGRRPKRGPFKPKGRYVPPVNHNDRRY
jgi:hypothetical protein